MLIPANSFKKEGKMYDQAVDQNLEQIHWVPAYGSDESSHTGREIVVAAKIGEV